MQDLQKTLAGQVAYWAETQPCATAISIDDDCCSYLALWQQAQRVAKCLASCDVQPGDRVVTLLPEPSSHAAAMLGTWMTGGVFVPLNPIARASEVESVLRCCEPKVLLTGEIPIELSNALASANQTVRHLTWEHVEKTASKKPVQVRPPQPDTIAQLLFTSGTTGEPKGVALTYENLRYNTTSIVDYLQIGNADICLNVMPFNFSYGNSVLLSHLWSGARIHAVRNAAFPSVIVKELIDRKVTSLPGVPTLFRSLISRSNLGRRELHALRYVAIAGGAMSPQELDTLQEALPDTRIFVMYGQTEATARISYLIPEMRCLKPASVGLPLTGTEVSVVNEEGHLLAAGEVGEICVRGPGVMAGYWQPEGLVKPEKSWLSTGDLGFKDDEGYLYLNGRRNEMIKSGGHRLFAREIEDVLNRHENVIESAVVKADDKLLGEVPVGYVVCRTRPVNLIRDLMHHCKVHLDAPKVPRKITVLDELPKTASGKIRKTALPGA